MGVSSRIEDIRSRVVSFSAGRDMLRPSLKEGPRCHSGLK